MEPMFYGEIISERIREARKAAEQERRASRRSVHLAPVVGAWRVALGRQLVLLGDRVAGCAELARGESVSNPSVRLVG